MNTRAIAILGLIILAFSSILPWPFGGGVELSLLSFYWGFIFSIFSGLGLFLGGAFNITNWQTLAQLIALIIWPVGIYIAYKAIRGHSPSIYQGIGGLAGVLMIAAAFTRVPSFNLAEGAYVAIFGGVLLELACILSGHNRHYKHTYHRRRYR